MEARRRFFWLLTETFYLDELDRQTSKAPFGIEFAFKSSFLQGLTLYAGPELFKDARPSIMLKYYREFWGIKIGALIEQELGITESEKTAKDTAKESIDTIRRKASIQLGYKSPTLFNNS